MPNKIKITLLIFGVIALLLDPSLAVYAKGISIASFMSAVAFNVAYFIASSVLFYCMWFWRYKTLKDEDKDSFRGVPALLGYFALYLAIPASLIFSVLSFFVLKASNMEFGLAPSALGAATAGLILGYRLPKVKK